MSGLEPKSADEVNANLSTRLRNFVNIREGVFRDNSWLVGVSLQQPPYEMSAEDETNLKTAFSQLNTDLQALDMTFVMRCVGLFP